MHVIHVASADDPRLDDFRNLTDADVRPDRRGIVIGEGVNVVERMAASPYRMRAVIGVESRIDALRGPLSTVGVPGYVVDKWVLSEVVGFRVTRGALAAADRGQPLDADAVIARASRVALLEGLNDFENIGSVFRNAAAFGLDAVLLDRTCADPLYRRCVRVSMGHALRVPFAVLVGSAARGVESLRAGGFGTYALTPHGDAVDLHELPRPEKWAVLLGAEGHGLSDATMAAADERVRIPMAGGVDSLNVATAAAVAFFHLA